MNYIVPDEYRASYDKMYRDLRIRLEEKYSVTLTKKEDSKLIDAMLLGGGSIRVTGRDIVLSVSESDLRNYAKTDAVIREILKAMDSFEVIYDIKDYYVTDILLGVSIGVIKRYGYKPSRQSNSTKVKTMREYVKLLNKEDNDLLRDLLKMYGKEIRGTKEVMAKYAKEGENYAEIVDMLLQSDYIHHTHVGYISSAYLKYDNELKRDDNEKSEYIATLGETVIVNAVLEDIRDVSTRFGTSVVLTFRTTEGDIFTTFLPNRNKANVYRLYASYTLKFEVGTHDIYRGIKSTTVKNLEKIKK